MKRLAVFAIGGLAAIALVISLGASFIALEPGAIDKPDPAQAKPTVIKIPDPPKAAEPSPPPPEPQKSTSLMADLAPESFSNSLTDLGGGIGFGGGGSGPVIGGSGGFGAAGSLAKAASEVSRAPRAVSKSPPEYPAEARSRGVSGYVVLKIFVGINGAIESVKVEQSEPRGFFDEAALRAIRAWRFEPALSKGQSVASWTTQKIKFDLN